LYCFLESNLKYSTTKPLANSLVKKFELVKEVKNNEIKTVNVDEDASLIIKSATDSTLLNKRNFAKFSTNKPPISTQDKVVNSRNNYQINRRLNLDKNKFLTSLDLVNLNRDDSLLLKAHATAANKSLLALNLFTTSINERKMIENDNLNNSRIKHIKNNLFQINKTKFNSSNNLKLKNSIAEPKKTRPESQEGIIEECKNSLDALIKASKWTTNTKNICTKDEEKLDELPLASLSLSITATDVFNRSSTSSTSSLECVGNLSSFAEPKLDDDEELNKNSKLHQESDKPLLQPQHQQQQQQQQTQDLNNNNNYNSSKPPLNKSMLPRSGKNFHNIGPSFSPKLIQVKNSLINKSTSCNSNLNQKSDFSNTSPTTEIQVNSSVKSQISSRLAQPEYVDLDSDFEKENENFETADQNKNETQFVSGFVQFRNNNNNKKPFAIDYTSHFNTNLNGIKNLSLSNLSQANGN
jgi:hypothetical protein